MEILFVELLKISVLCGVGILVIFAVSPLLRKTHTVFWRYCLWALLALRLILPFDFSLSKQAVVFPIPVGTVGEKTSVVFTESGRETEGSPTKNSLAAQKAEEKAGSNGTGNNKTGNIPAEEKNIRSDTEQKEALQKMAARRQKAGIWEYILHWASIVWAAGAILLLVWQAACYVLFFYQVNRTKTFYGKKENLSVYRSFLVSTPMLVGIRKPQIVLADREYAKDELAFILEHEYCHYKRKDLWIKLLLASAKTLHWFNPLVIWMERQAIWDMELLCDSRVVRNFSREEKKQYGAALLNCASAKKNRIAVLCTSEFSRDVKTLKGRFANIFSGEGKKQGILAVILGGFLLLSLSLFVVFGTSEKGGKDAPFEPEDSVSEEMYADDIKNEEETEAESEGDVADFKMQDFGRITGKAYLYGDENGWSYYLEEDEGKESALWEIADILEPLLLTRYKGGERQVLEDLIYQEAWMECPVLFVDGRVIYKAAQSADIVGVKDATLVSIAMDGSDRKIADTIQYRVFDGLCEDGGWIYYSGWTNDALLPKPLCRISPDFRSGAQLVEEIPGYLCGVMDGYVFYLAGKDKYTGIWKRNLSTGEEQIYDKWGIAAEEIPYFSAREWQFMAGELRNKETPGCHILYKLEDGGEMIDYKLPFDVED